MEELALITQSALMWQLQHMLSVNKSHHSVQLMELLVSQLQDAQSQLYKQVAFWELMEIVDGYQLLELLLLNVLYILHVLLHKEPPQHNAYFGDQLVFQMELLASQRQHAHHTILKLVVVMQELMEHASMLPRLVQQQQELADYNYVLMRLLQQPQVFQLMLDVSDFLLQHLAQHLELDVSHNLLVDHTQSKLVVFKEQMEFVSGLQQQRMQQPPHQLQHQAFADKNNAQIHY